MDWVVTISINSVFQTQLFYHLTIAIMIMMITTCYIIAEHKCQCGDLHCTFRCLIFLILIPCISNMDFREVSTKWITGLAKQDGPKCKENKTATSWNQAKTFLLHKPPNLSLWGTEIEEAMNEKLLGVKIDKHLNWNSHIDYMITKLNSRINLLKRARK